MDETTEKSIAELKARLSAIDAKLIILAKAQLLAVTSVKAMLVESGLRLTQLESKMCEDDCK